MIHTYASCLDHLIEDSSAKKGSIYIQASIHRTFLALTAKVATQTSLITGPLFPKNISTHSASKVSSKIKKSKQSLSNMP